MREPKSLASLIFMSIDEINALHTRMDRVKEEIKFLKANMPNNEEELVEDDVKRRSIERSVEIALEATLDLARLIISVKNLPKAQTNSELFYILAENHIIPHKFADKIRGIGNLRNILVHEYTGIDYEILFETLKDLEDLEKFVEYIEEFQAGNQIE